jgi:hypothetical protein
MLRTFNFKAILSRWAVKKDEGALQKRSDFEAIPAYIVIGDCMALRSNVLHWRSTGNSLLVMPGQRD